MDIGFASGVTVFKVLQAGFLELSFLVEISSFQHARTIDDVEQSIHDKTSTDSILVCTD